MTTLTIPKLERRFLQAVEDEMDVQPVREWDEQSFRLVLSLLRAMRQHTANMQQVIEAMLTKGCEARSFARLCGPLLPAVEQHLERLQALLKRVSPVDDPQLQALLAELSSTKKENEAFRDLLSQALSRATELPRPVDGERVRAAEEAHARGETKPFSRH